MRARLLPLLALLALLVLPAGAQDWFDAPFVLEGGGYSQGFGDVDGDGDVDAASAGGAFLQALLNDGTGVFTAGATTPIGGDGTAGTLDGILADVDGDGADEIGVTWGSVFSATSFAWVDWTGGDFVQSPSVQLSIGHAGLVAADFSGDGVPDLATATSFGPPAAHVLPTVTP